MPIQNATGRRGIRLPVVRPALWLALVFVLLGLTGLIFIWWWPRIDAPQSASLVVREIVRPWSGAPDGVVVLLSNGHYGLREIALARWLSFRRAAVIGVDTEATLRNAGSGSAFARIFPDLDRLSRDTQGRLGLATPYPSVVAGEGVGGAVALALTPDIPQGAAERIIAVDPAASVPARWMPFTPPGRPAAASGDGWTYDLPTGSDAEPIDVFATAAADPAAVARIANLVSGSPAANLSRTDYSAASILGRSAFGTLIRARQRDGTPQSDGLASTIPDEKLATLPLTLVPATAERDTMAIMISGDGGWRDFDRRIGDGLAAQGVPTIGLDSLIYFWKEQRPSDVAADVARIMAVFMPRLGVHKVLLVGFSFGADLLPAVYDLLPDDKKIAVSRISLLSYSGSRQFEIAVSGILGMVADPNGPTTLDELRRVPPEKLQCLYGVGDKRSMCPRAGVAGMDTIVVPGDHHLGYDGVTVVDRMLSGLDRLPRR